ENGEAEVPSRKEEHPCPATTLGDTTPTSRNYVLRRGRLGRLGRCGRCSTGRTCHLSSLLLGLPCRATLLGGDLLRLARLLQGLALVRCCFAYLACLEHDERAYGLLPCTDVLPFKGQRSHPVGAHHHPALLELPVFEDLHLGRLRGG